MKKNKNTFEDMIKDLVEESKKYKTCMSLKISEKGQYVSLCLDTGANTYSEWIKGEGADIHLIRCMETNKIMGCRLPLIKSNLAVFYDGPVKINEGFLKEENET